MRLRFRSALVGFAVGALVVACSRPEPSRTPLSGPEATAAPRARRSFSRAVEPSEPREEQQEIEITADDDDGDGDSARTPTSSRASSGNAGAGPGASLSSSTSVAGGGAGRCTAVEGPAPDCGALAAAGGCLGASLARRACETLGPAVDARVGAAWLSCMRSPPSAAAACDSHRIVDCGLRAIGAACVDGSFAGTCADIAASCADVAPEITAPVCEHLLGAWKPAERPKMLECLRHGCDTGGFGACLP